MEEILEFVADVSEELGSQEEIGYMRRILENGNGADRQLRVFQETGDLKQVVDYMIQETEYGIEPARTGKPNDKTTEQLTSLSTRN